MDAATAPARRLRAREKEENFPVALRWLPREPRRHLHAVYAATRLIDETGDAAPGDRVSRLLALRAQVTALWQGHTPDDPVLQMLASTVTACTKKTMRLHSRRLPYRTTEPSSFATVAAGSRT